MYEMAPRTTGRARAWAQREGSRRWRRRVLTTLASRTRPRGPASPGSQPVTRSRSFLNFSTSEIEAAAFPVHPRPPVRCRPQPQGRRPAPGTSRLWSGQTSPPPTWATWCGRLLPGIGVQLTQRLLRPGRNSQPPMVPEPAHGALAVRPTLVRSVKELTCQEGGRRVNEAEKVMGGFKKKHLTPQI